MAKISKDFFSNNEVVFVGYSGKNEIFSKMIYQAFENKGIKVYPVNNRKDAQHSIKVYKNISEIPKKVESAFVLLKSENAKTVIDDLSKQGVKKILFQNKKAVSPDVLDKCKSLGIQTAVACPMMIVGSGFHKLHGFFAGV